MTGREYLNQIRDTDLNIKCKEREVLRLQQDIMYLQALDYSKDIVSGGQPITFEDKIANIDALSNELMREWSGYLRERERARFLITQYLVPSKRRY